jgi:hypothetical protein
MHENMLAGAARFPAHWLVKADLGFYGMRYPHPRVEWLHKKPWGAALTETQKKENRVLASEHVIFEHVGACVKIWRIVKDIYRNHKHDLDIEVFIVACAPLNIRLSSQKE